MNHKWMLPVAVKVLCSFIPLMLKSLFSLSGVNVHEDLFNSKMKKRRIMNTTLSKLSNYTNMNYITRTTHYQRKKTAYL